MRLSLKGRRGDGLPAEITGALSGLKGDRILAGAPDADSRAWLVAATYTVSLVDPALGLGRTLAWSRPWHEVDAGSWGRDSAMLTLTWVDRSRPVQWRLGVGQQEQDFLQTLRERVQASVVLAEELTLSGRRTGRAVIRQDLRTGELLQQVVLGPRVVEDDEVSVAADRALTWLREQVGMPHP